MSFSDVIKRFTNYKSYECLMVFLFFVLISIIVIISDVLIEVDDPTDDNLNGKIQL